MKRKKTKEGLALVRTKTFPPQKCEGRKRRLRRMGN
jgi:hypothetical protein